MENMAQNTLVVNLVPRGVHLPSLPDVRVFLHFGKTGHLALIDELLLFLAVCSAFGNIGWGGAISVGVAALCGRVGGETYQVARRNLARLSQLRVERPSLGLDYLTTLLSSFVEGCGRIKECGSSNNQSRD